MLTKNDLSQIKTVVQETIRPEIQALKKNMATKEEMMTLETGLKGNIKNLETSLRNNIKGLETRLKDDIKTLEVRLIDRIDEAQMEIIATVDKHKADKVEVDKLEERVGRLEDNAELS